MTFRMYFKGTDPNPALPPPVPFKEVIVPVAKTKEDVNYLVRLPSDTDQAAPVTAPPSVGPTPMELMESAEDRMAILKELRAHMDLLNDFVGIIPQEQLNRRKRELYDALPSPPPSTMVRMKRTRRVGDDQPGVEV